MFSPFGCSHGKTTFPITLRNPESPLHDSPKTYIVCLDCGKEIPYSWAEMKAVKNTWLSITSPARNAARRFRLSAANIRNPEPSDLRT